MQTIYSIGGSPCSGKSTIAGLLSEKYGFISYKLDDHLDDYIAKCARAGKPVSSRYTAMTLDELWLRDPYQHCVEELLIYEEFFEFVAADIAAMGDEKPIIAEGAGLLPSLMRQSGVGASHYICVVPTNDFQYRNFKDRPWVQDYLFGCSDPETAFENWMQRDYFFADAVHKQALDLGYPALVVDGTTSIQENFITVEHTFTL